MGRDATPPRSVMNSRRFVLALYFGDVRFGSKPDICTAKRHVRFTPNSDTDCVFRHVCFGPIADIQSLLASLRIDHMVSCQSRSLSMAKGTVKWFNPTKGYGFIQPSGGGARDVFVHISAVEKAGLSTLREGQQIEYEIVSNRGRESAENLKVK